MRTSEHVAFVILSESVHAARIYYLGSALRDTRAAWTDPDKMTKATPEVARYSNPGAL